MKNKKPLKENKWYIASIVLASCAVVFFILAMALFDVGVAGQVFIALSILSAAAIIITFSLGYVEAHPEEAKKSNQVPKSKSDNGGHFDVWGDPDWEQKSEDEKEWEDIEFFEMMEDD